VINRKCTAKNIFCYKKIYSLDFVLVFYDFDFVKSINFGDKRVRIFGDVFMIIFEHFSESFSVVFCDSLDNKIAIFSVILEIIQLSSRGAKLCQASHCAHKHSPNERFKANAFEVFRSRNRIFVSYFFKGLRIVVDEMIVFLPILITD
jgi:hypothetical protein